MLVQRKERSSRKDRTYSGEGGQTPSTGHKQPGHVVGVGVAVCLGWRCDEIAEYALHLVLNGLDFRFVLVEPKGACKASEGLWTAVRTSEHGSSGGCRRSFSVKIFFCESVCDQVVCCATTKKTNGLVSRISFTD